MNYTIKYPASASLGQTSQMSTSQVPVPLNSTGQIVITSPQQQSQCQPPVNGNAQFPMVMQMSSLAGGQIFYTYPEGMVNTAVHNKSNNSCASNNSSISQVVLSPVPQTSLNILKNNGNSPNAMQTVNISSESKGTAARSLGELFNLSGLPNQTPLVATNSAHIAQTVNQTALQSPTEIANLLSSLQAAGVQIVDNVGSASANTGVQLNSCNEQGTDKNMTNFIQNLQSSGLNVVENNAEKTLSIPLGQHHAIEEKNVLHDNKFVGAVPVENVYKLVDGTGNVTVFTTGSAETAQNLLNEDVAM